MHENPLLKTFALPAFILAAFFTNIHAQNATTPGELLQERPTLICLGVDWRYTGDDNENAEVRVAYRQVGTDAWSEALPLLRSGGSGEGYGAYFGPSTKNLPKPDDWLAPRSFMGSIFDLEPGTAYEVKLTMSDPDGVEGEATQLITMKTRAEPQPYVNGEVRHVYPPGFKGERQEPAYWGIMHAVNGYQPNCDCFQTVHPHAAPPGTLILVHAGEYKADPSNYRHGMGLWQHGTHVLVSDGEPGKPIAIVAAGDGEVVFDGAGADTLFHVAAADYLYFEGLTFRNSRVTFYAGFQGTQGSKGLTIKNCRFENIDYGVLAQDGQSEDFYIADNVFIGGGIGPDEEYGAYAVNLSGQGHVVCYNYTENFWDHINVFTNALADPALEQQARSIDFYNNDMRMAHDNFIEADGGYGNIRVLRNRMYHTRISGWAWPMSLQPVYVGPAYFVRNIVYNTARGQKTFKNLSSTRLQSYHNSSTSTMIGFQGPGAMFNNVFAPFPVKPPTLSLDNPKEKPYTIDLGSGGNPEVYDYNAHLRIQFEYPSYRLKSRNNEQLFESFAAFSEATGIGKHSIELLSFDQAFSDVEPPLYRYREEGTEAQLPANDSMDFTPPPGSPLIDAAKIIPGINDGFVGSAPDIGAIERGAPPIHFGPRN